MPSAPASQATVAPVVPPATGMPADPVAAATVGDVVPPVTGMPPAFAVPPASDGPPFSPRSVTSGRAPTVSTAAGSPPPPDLGAPWSPAEVGSDPLAVPPPDQKGRRRAPKVLLAVAGAVVLVVGLYVGACFALSDRVPRGTTVAGVAIGGKSAADARKALDSGLADAGTTPVVVVADGKESTFVPTDAGLALDSRATVASVTGPRLTEPGHLWQHIAGGGAVTPVTTTDKDKLAAAVDALDAPVHVDPVDATVVFADGTAQVTPATEGQGLDTEAATRTIAAQWLTADGPLTLKTVALPPQITDAEAQRAVTEQAEPLMAGPITVAVEDGTASLTVPQLTAAAAFVPRDGGLVLTLDGPTLVQQVATQLPALLNDAADAHFEFDPATGQPVVIPGVLGKTVAPDTLAAALVTASTTPDRTATVELVESHPEQSREELEGLGVKEVVGEFSTPLTSEPRRTTNITNGARLINGTLVRPGETFSLGGTLEPVDASNGFVEAGVINNGIHTDGMGGGLSQLSTTTYNAAFESGMELVEHKPHSEWISRYPEGRESTLFYPQLDMKWTNNTPYGALVKAWVDPNPQCAQGKTSSSGCVHVQIWSTKYWKVEAETFPRQNVVAPTTVHLTSPNCEPSSAGNSGFLSTGVRRVYLDGVLKHEDPWSWTYKPSNQIICDTPP